MIELARELMVQPCRGRGRRALRTYQGRANEARTRSTPARPRANRPARVSRQSGRA
jgi:hypothetical protein